MADKEEQDTDELSGKFRVGRTKIQKRIQEVESLLEKQMTEVEGGWPLIQTILKALKSFKEQDEEHSQKLRTILTEFEDLERMRPNSSSGTFPAPKEAAHASEVPVMSEECIPSINEENEQRPLDEVSTTDKGMLETMMSLLKRFRELHVDIFTHGDEKSEKAESMALLQEETRKLLEERSELLRAGRTLRTKQACLKEEFHVFQTCFNVKSNEVASLVARIKILEKEKEESGRNFRQLEQELKSRMRTLADDLSLEKNHSEALEEEVQELMDKNHEVLQGRLAFEKRAEQLKANVMELEDELEYESQSHLKTKKALSSLTKENKNLESEVRTLREETTQKSQALAEIKEKKQTKSKMVKELTQIEKQLERSLTEERRKSESLEEQKIELESAIVALKEDIRVMIQEDEKEKRAMDTELHELRPLREKAGTLEKELAEVKEKQRRESRDEDDTLRCEMETMRHRLVSNVIKPLEAASLPGTFRVNAADISQGKSKAWSKVKEALTSLIKDNEGLNSQNAKLYQAWSRLSHKHEAKSQECESLQRKLDEGLQVSLFIVLTLSLLRVINVKFPCSLTRNITLHNRMETWLSIA